MGVSYTLGPKASKTAEKASDLLKYVAELSTVAGFIYLLVLFQIRSEARERFQLPGNYCTDCCTSLWCSCCSIAQIATHVKSYKPGSCDFGPPDELPAYM